MKVSLSTGGYYDYILFRAETVAECSELVAAGLSGFVRLDAPDRMVLDSWQAYGDQSTVMLKIRLSENFTPSPQEQAVINAEHDVES